MNFRFLICGLAMISPCSSIGQTCTPTSIPTEILRSNQVITGQTTCGGSAGLNLGGTIYPHPSKVYEFIAQNAHLQVTISAGSTDIEMSLVSGCTSAPLAIGFLGGPMVVPAATLTNGTKYFLVVSKDPSLPPLPAPGVCGAYGLSVNGIVPVALQKFSVN